MSQDVFISYSRDDLGFIVEFDNFLVALGISTWFDKKSLLSGRRWEDAIEDEIQNSTVFITCLSKTGTSRPGFFHAEQALAEKAALKMPREKLFIVPVLLGDCEIPRTLRQYNATNLVEPGSFELLLLSVSMALDRKIVATQEQIAAIREVLIAHLGMETMSLQMLVDRFLDKNLPFQDSVGIIENIANLNATTRLSSLLHLRSLDFISYAEQAALDLTIEEVRHGRRISKLQEKVRDAEWARIQQMAVLSGDLQRSVLLRQAKYARYITRKNNENYGKLEEAIANVIFT